MKKLLVCILLASCAPSYWVRDADLRAAQAGASVVPCVTADGTIKHLDGERVALASVEAQRGELIRVRPPNRAVHVGRVLLAVGAVLGAGSIIAAATLNQPRGCRDEECWVSQGAAALAFGLAAAHFLGAGVITIATSRHDAEMK